MRDRGSGLGIRGLRRTTPECPSSEGIVAERGKASEPNASRMMRLAAPEARGVPTGAMEPVTQVNRPDMNRSDCPAYLDVPAPDHHHACAVPPTTPTRAVDKK